jgi:hypothetical protein
MKLKKLITEVSQAPLPKGLKGLKGSERGEKGRMLCATKGVRGKGLKPCILSPLRSESVSFVAER